MRKFEDDPLHAALDAQIAELRAENSRLLATRERLAMALESANLAINPPDRGGISLDQWNLRLKAATENIHSALNSIQSEVAPQGTGQ